MYRKTAHVCSETLGWQFATLACVWKNSTRLKRNARVAICYPSVVCRKTAHEDKILKDCESQGPLTPNRRIVQFRRGRRQRRQPVNPAPHPLWSAASVRQRYPLSRVSRSGDLLTGPASAADQTRAPLRPPPFRRQTFISQSRFRKKKKLAVRFFSLRCLKELNS